MSVENRKEKVLVVGEAKGNLNRLTHALSDHYEVITAESAREALNKARSEKPAVVTIDLDLVPHSPSEPEGMDILRELAVINRQKVVVFTADAQRRAAVRALRVGAFDYSGAPANADDLVTIIERAVNFRKLEVENENLQIRIDQSLTFNGIIGSCPRIEEVSGMVRAMADADVPVLVEGEKGTGKEMTARAIHDQSARRRGPFLVVDCGAVPDELLESELFGHEKGAFNGAHAQRRGKLYLAEGGTLFLAEVDEIPGRIQVKLLRFLLDGTVERQGGRSSLFVDARIIAAANQDMERPVSAGLFREELYHKLATVTICLPPLRERGEDILLLARHFLQRFSREMNKEIRDFSQDAATAMLSYSWPGNVRELENKVKRGVIISRDPRLTALDMGLPAGDPMAAPGTSLKKARRELDMRYIRQAMQRTSGNISRAARELGISRVCLHELLKKYSINVPRGRQ